MNERNHDLITPRSVAIAGGIALAAVSLRKAHNALKTIEPSPEEMAIALPGDDIVPDANVVLDRAFTLHGTPEEVWPWITQIGPDRGGWPLPGSVERLMPAKKRGAQTIDPSLPELKVGSKIGDWRINTNDFKDDEKPTAEVAILEPDHAVVFKAEKQVSKKGNVVPWSWAIVVGEGETNGDSRVQMRFRAGNVKHKELIESLGPLDGLAMAGFAAGVNERLEQAKQHTTSLDN